MASTKPVESDGPIETSNPETFRGGDAEKSLQEGGASHVESATQDKGKEKVEEEGVTEEKTAPDSR